MTTAGGVFRLDKQESNALGNWEKGSQQDMPTRYHGARQLTALGVKMEVIEMLDTVYKQVAVGDQLTWARVASLAPNKLEVQDRVSRIIAECDNPTCEQESADIFTLKSKSSQAQKEETTPERVHPTGEDESSSSSSSSSGASSSEEEVTGGTTDKDQDTLAALTAYIGQNELIAHPTRGALHISESGQEQQALCGEALTKWPTILPVTVAEATQQFWPMCSRTKCCGALDAFHSRKMASKTRSGRPI